MIAEEWRPVVGHEGLYEVSDRGQVRGVDRVVVFGEARSMTKPGVVLVTHLDRWGYEQVGLSRDGRKRTLRVHRLVADAFLPERPADAVLVRHLDGDLTRNVPSNLAWGTAGENEKDKVGHGTHSMSTRQACPAEHALVAPNLAPSALRAGRRRCLACRRAQDVARRAARRGEVVDVRATADRFYIEIMGEAA